MMRRIHCQKCGASPLHPADLANGYAQRAVLMAVAKPKDHFITVNGVRYESKMLCDLCGEEIATGTPAHVITMWQTRREAEPGNWEREFAYDDRKTTH